MIIAGTSVAGGLAAMTLDGGDGFGTNPLQNEAQYYQDQVDSMQHSLETFNEHYQEAMNQGNDLKAFQLKQLIESCQNSIENYQQYVDFLNGLQ